MPLSPTLRRGRSGLARAAALVLPCVALAGALAGCQRGDRAAAAASPAARADAPAADSFYASPFEKHPDAAALTVMGRALFADASLSLSGRVSCASCHDPAHAFGPPNGLATQLGGADLAQPGVRAVPSLRYRQTTPPFSEHYSDTDGDDSADQGPTGGRGWDGRSQSAHEQAAVPLLSPFEMANADRGSVVARLRRSPNAAQLRQVFGEHTLDDERLAWNALLWALEVYQQSPEEFYPYTSKYDAFLRRTAALSPSEARGLALFNDASKGNCALCHPSAIKRGAFPQFTDNGFIAIGVPRNRRIPANADPAYFDLGLCGPLRTDLSDRPEYCGMFKTPSLRNVATRRVFFHNGVFRSLDEAVRFYAERDVRPEKFYPRDGRGRVRRFDDLPAADHANVNVEAPFDRHPGDAPALNEAEVRDVVAFLKTLNDADAMNADPPGRSTAGGRRTAAPAGPPPAATRQH